MDDIKGKCKGMIQMDDVKVESEGDDWIYKTGI